MNKDVRCLVQHERNVMENGSGFFDFCVRCADGRYVLYLTAYVVLYEYDMVLYQADLM